MTETQLFDEWPEYYDRWFTTPIGKLVKEIEAKLINELLEPATGEKILDAGCGTGIFTLDFLTRGTQVVGLDFLTRGTQVVGLDISRPMLMYALKKTAIYPFFTVQGDMLHLPFRDNWFDKSVSITALEFIENAQRAVNELFRVTKPGGCVVIATLNSLSPWAERRQAKTRQGQKHLLEGAFYRSPDELLTYSHLKGVVKTAVHFDKNDYPIEAIEIEKSGQSRNLDTGAFVAVRWEKPL